MNPRIPRGGRLLALGLASMLVAATGSMAEVVGSVSTKFKIMGPNDKIVVEVFEDPEVPGVACYLSRAKTGGISGAVGVAEDTSDASLDCRQIGPIALPAEVASGAADGDDVFKKRTSLLTKTMQVVRFYDAPRNTLVYLSYSDRIIEGSPKNSVSVVVVKPWRSTASAHDEGPGQVDPRATPTAAGSQAPATVPRVQFGGANP